MIFFIVEVYSECFESQQTRKEEFAIFVFDNV